MLAITALVLLAIGAPALSQTHLGPIGTMPPSTNCYHCDDHHWSFPGCLNNPHPCGQDEVCSIVYGNGYPDIKCKKADDCARDIANPMRDCSGGGVEVHMGECQKCCSDAGCTDDLVNLLKMEFQQQDQLFCPGHCGNHDIGTCISNGRYCNQGQFCQVELEHGQVSGHCKDDHDYHHCETELTHHKCQTEVGNHHHDFHGKCVWDCCNTNNCLQNHFGAFLTTKAPATTMAPAPDTTMPAVDTTMAPAMTTMAPAMTTMAPAVTTMAATASVAATAATTAAQPMTTMDAVTTDAPAAASNTTDPACMDHLAGVGCQELQDVCQTVLALSVCPKYCGLC